MTFLSLKMFETVGVFGLAQGCECLTFCLLWFWAICLYFSTSNSSRYQPRSYQIIPWWGIKLELRVCCCDFMTSFKNGNASSIILRDFTCPFEQSNLSFMTQIRTAFIYISSFKSKLDFSQEFPIPNWWEIRRIFAIQRRLF